MFRYVIYMFFGFLIGVKASCKNVQTPEYNVVPSDGGAVVLDPFIKIGSKYYYVNGKDTLNWFEAAHVCRTYGADLATISSAQELKAVSNYLLLQGYKGKERFYLSYNDLGDEGNFHSIATGNPMTFASWSPGQPDNAGGNEHCVHLWIRNGAYQMNDLPCGSQEHYICQLPHAIASNPLFPKHRQRDNFETRKVKKLFIKLVEYSPIIKDQ